MNSKIRKLIDPGYKKLCQGLQKLNTALAAKCAEQQTFSSCRINEKSKSFITNETEV
ncbi:MAG: hypothetical protein GOP50_03280 [Candidatus Heimdallarchaeota archaeon]|nr:hypothetical protein [Candidatus Heimdallarchaeota archaeon]